MSNTEILNHFYGASNVYKFFGSFTELQHLMESQSVSFNSLAVQGTIYFACQKEIVDERVSPVVTGE